VSKVKSKVTKMLNNDFDCELDCAAVMDLARLFVYIHSNL
jgi:hypothetical protein